MSADVCGSLGLPRYCAGILASLVVLLTACAETTQIATSRPSAEANQPTQSECCEAVPTPAPTPTASDVRAAFLAVVHDSTLSYHAERRVDGVYTSHGEQTLLTQLVSVDVSGTDYSASTSITTTDPSGATTQSAFKVVALGDSMFVRLGTDPWEKTARSSAEPPANPFRRLNENELTFMGMTDEDLFEFDIRIWIGESPASFEEPPEQPAAMTAFYLGDHKTSVLVDSSGVPHALFSEYAVRTVIDVIPGTERFVEEYTRVGEAIRIEAPTDAHTAALAVPMTIPSSRAHAFPSPRIGLLGY